ncbi:hypothetical protein F4859DRAFT_495118 [Xylaria cf. heliscus]|nr:hypothetical protein F4859DRAFT_495118 [Xylaria cf. heliscus]
MSLSYSSHVSIRDQWARQKAIHGIKEVWNDFVYRSNTSDTNKQLLSENESLAPAPSPPMNQSRPTQQNVVKLGIVGAGAAGLFTAMVLDYLNAELSKRHGGARTLVFEYEILEANSFDRLGGRLFTYNFSGEGDPHNYYDVGAMRFPKTPVMKRLFDLFDKLGMQETDLETQPNAPNGSIIPYYMKNGDTQSQSIEPWRYNDITIWAGSYDQVRVQSTDDDPFKMAKDENIPLEIRRHSPDDIMKATVQLFHDALQRDLQTHPAGREGWELLMRYDTLSTRQFLGMAPPEPLKGDIPSPPYNYDTIQWMETFNGGTNGYDQAHSETVLESLDFDYSDETKWYCILGGAQTLGTKMHEKITYKAVFDSRVTAIRAKDPMQVELKVATPQGESEKSFHAVFNTTTLSCLRKMDTSEAGLNYATKQASRSLGYGSSAKVAIKFKRAWWIHDLGRYSIRKGGVGHSDLMTRTCVYPSYNIYDDDSKPAVLLCSYTWQQDAQRLASLMSNNEDHDKKVEDEADLKELLFRELARLHANSDMTTDQLYSLIRENYIDHHAYDWDKDPTTMGAFALFRPQQFSRVWNKLIQPSGDVVIIGEAASPHHAWVVGALESAVHGIHSWLGMNRGRVPEFQDAMLILEREEDGNPFTGLPPYLDANISRWHSVLGLIGRDENFGDVVTRAYVQGLGRVFKL